MIENTRINNGIIDRVYNSISDAELDNNLQHNHSHINNVLSGMQKECGGYGWVSLEYSKFIHYFVNKTQESVSLEEQFQAYALIYNALLRGLRVPSAPQESAETSLQAVFQGFHF